MENKLNTPIRSALILILAWAAICRAAHATQPQPRPRVLVSSDIGGTDPDDFQSMIHLLMYADRFRIEGLVSSPYGKGRKTDILRIIDLYGKDYLQLRAHDSLFPSPGLLKRITKQGALDMAPYKGYSRPTEGSRWIVQCARRKSDQPLWVLVWGGLEDLAQALHDAPDIEKNIRVYWIGGPNKKWSVNAYAYIAAHFPGLRMIEDNSSYRGWIIDEGAPPKLKADAYYQNFIQGHGALGADFVHYYGGTIKMGDSPSVAYLLSGDPDDPEGESWGGSFSPMRRSSRTIFRGNSALTDTVAVYSVLEWRFRGPELDIPRDSACFTLQTGGQEFPGYYLGDGIYGVRYSSKKPETGTYVIKSAIPALDGQRGGYLSRNPWPGKPRPADYRLGKHWYSDRTDPSLFIAEEQGARTVGKFRSDILLDWATRWAWLK